MHVHYRWQKTATVSYQRKTQTENIFHQVDFDSKISIFSYKLPWARLLTEVRQRLWNSGRLDLIGFSVLGFFPEQISRERGLPTDSETVGREDRAGQFQRFSVSLSETGPTQEAMMAHLCRPQPTFGIRWRVSFKIRSWRSIRLSLQYIH